MSGLNVALVLAGGTGTRVGSDVPKQYIRVCDKLIITYCLKTIAGSGCIDAIFIVADEMWHDAIIEDARKNVTEFDEKFKGFAVPGENRQLSILNGLREMDGISTCDFAENVLIHDAARPCVTKQMIKACMDGLKMYDGILPVLPMKDTVYISNDGKSIASLIDRKSVVAGQAPESFRYKKYLASNERLLPDEILKVNGSTEPAILAGMNVGTIPGDEKNFKITTKADLQRFLDSFEA